MPLIRKRTTKTAEHCCFPPPPDPNAEMQRQSRTQNHERARRLSPAYVTTLLRHSVTRLPRSAFFILHCLSCLPCALCALCARGISYPHRPGQNRGKTRANEGKSRSLRGMYGASWGTAGHLRGPWRTGRLARRNGTAFNPGAPGLRPQRENEGDNGQTSKPQPQEKWVSSRLTVPLFLFFSAFSAPSALRDYRSSRDHLYGISSA